MKNENFAIVAKLPETDNWANRIQAIVTPSTISLAVSASDPNYNIKKVTWDFGTGNQQKSVTNRKQRLHLNEMPCRYKKSNDIPITIQATIYTDEGVFTPAPLVTKTSNKMIKDHYVDPEEFKAQIVEFYKTGHFSDEVAISASKIANRLAFAGNFINYTYRDEMVGDALIKMMEALRGQKFDPEKGNPFSYFTKIAFHAFCNRIKKEKKARANLLAYQAEVYNSMKEDGMLPYSRPDMNDGDNDSGFSANVDESFDIEGDDEDFI